MGLWTALEGCTTPSCCALWERVPAWFCHAAHRHADSRAKKTAHFCPGRPAVFLHKALNFAIERGASGASCACAGSCLCQQLKPAPQAVPLGVERSSQPETTPAQDKARTSKESKGQAGQQAQAMGMASNLALCSFIDSCWRMLCLGCRPFSLVLGCSLPGALGSMHSVRRSSFRQ